MPDITGLSGAGGAAAIAQLRAQTATGPSAPKVDENQKAVKDTLDASHEKLKKATRQMESYFVGTLLKKMHETAAKGGLFEKSSETSTYRDMFDDAVAAEIGKRGSFGIADTLYKELVVHMDAQTLESMSANPAMTVNQSAAAGAQAPAQKSPESKSTATGK
jgi:Rod binding domain-containing protein